MDDRGWRAISLLLALACAVLLGISGAMILQGSGNPAPAASKARPTASPSAVAIGSASPRVSPSLAATASPTATASPRPSKSATPSPSAPTASIKFTNLMLDAETDAHATVRTFTFMSDGWGTVTAQVSATSPRGQTKMCITVDGSKPVCPTGPKPAMLNGFADTTHSLWTVTLVGLDVSTPTVDVVFTWPTALPEMRLSHARFQGQGAPDALNGVSARFTTHTAGTVKLQASWTVLQTDAKVTLANFTGGGSPDVVAQKQYSGVSSLNPPFSATLPGGPGTANQTYQVELRNLSADNQRPDLSVSITFPQ